MEYKQINEAWVEHLETLQSSKYMQRLSLKEDEKLFREGYMKGYEVALEKIYSINRLEVIDHTLTGEGRAYIKRGELEVEMQEQDSGKTIKIFIKLIKNERYKNNIHSR